MKSISVWKLWIMLMLTQSTHSIKLAQLKTNESNHILTHAQHSENWLYATNHRLETLAHSLYNSKDNKLRSVFKEIDLSSISLSFNYPDTALYINEGNALSIRFNLNFLSPIVNMR